MTSLDPSAPARRPPRPAPWLLGLASIVSLSLAGAACHHEGPVDDEWDFAVPLDLTVALTVEPQNAVIVVNAGQTTPSTASFKAYIAGQEVMATWQSDRDEVGTIDQAGLYSTLADDPATSGPKAIGGKVLIKASYSGLTGTAIATVQYKMSENGDPKCNNVGVIGPGGYGGVGGNGPGCAASPAQQTAVKSTPVVDPLLAWLYPYEATVFPRGLLAPLLMWDPATHDFDAMRLQMTSKSGTFVYDGTFAKPPGKPFINLPIPQATWEKMNISSTGDDVQVKVTLAQGSQAYGPVTINWHIASGSLRGIVYYNSYGTGLVTNSGEDDFNGDPFGAGTLSINPGKTDPKLVAGVASANNSGCRVCHSVSKDGSSLITQRGNAYQTSRSVNLKAANVETDVAGGNSAFPAMYPTGKFYFTSSGGMINGDPSGSHLYDLPAGNLVPVSGLPTGLKAALPAFSPDGKQLVFNFYAGTGSDQRSLAVMPFDEGTKTFGAVTPIYTPPGGPAVWPSFLPTTTGVVFQVEDAGGEFGYTRNGKQGQLWWVDVATKKAHALDKLNGVGYLPTSTSHPQDVMLNYEPTVNPVPSGGYAWVVFTSRRMYGNVATQDPKLSDPRNYDWKNNITTKKLWVAAIDLDGKVNTDPSHPAFYLPAQELHAGNSRGFWTVDPCAPAGAKCETGDQCCGGYCRNQSGGDGGADGLTCSSTTPLCSHEYEKCTKDADCCLLDPSIDPTGKTQPTCINGYCSVPTPTPIF